MIRITIYKNEKRQCVGFHAVGHSGYSEAGQDIVCAAVSVLIINTVNAIDKFTEDETSYISDDDEGMIDFRIKDKPTKEGTLLLKAMILGLEEVANDESYEEYIELTFEEV